MSEGLANALHGMLRELNGVRLRLENSLRLGQNDSTARLLDPITTTYMDMFEAYVSPATEVIFKELEEHAQDLFDEVRAFDTYDFVILLLLLLIIFTIVFRLFLNRFEFSLWKTKRMLAILPTKYMAEQMDAIRALIPQIS